MVWPWFDLVLVALSFKMLSWLYLTNDKVCCDPDLWPCFSDLDLSNLVCSVSVKAAWCIKFICCRETGWVVWVCSVMVWHWFNFWPCRIDLDPLNFVDCVLESMRRRKLILCRNFGRVLKVCSVMVWDWFDFWHSCVWPWPLKSCLGYTSEAIRCKKLILGRDIGLGGVGM